MRQSRSAIAWAGLLGLAAIAGLGKMALGLAGLARQIVTDHGVAGLVAQPGFSHKLGELAIAGCASAVLVAAALDRAKGLSILNRLTPWLWLGGALNGISWFMQRADGRQAIWPLTLTLIGVAAPTILEQCIRWTQRQETILGSGGTPRAIHAEISIAAPIQRVWEAWTTAEGIKSFLAPDCHIDLRLGGHYEIYFDLDAAPGRRGSEGAEILAFQEPVMLSFTWNAPPSLPSVRFQRTHVVVRLEEIAADQTKVSIVHDGWGQGGEWDAALAYFERAWHDIVLPRLRYRFSVAPVDWEHPPG